MTLALPMQSIAAAARVGCGMAHPASAAQKPRQAEALAAGEAEDVHAHRHGQARSAAPADAHGEDGCQAADHAGCGACAGCCLGAYAPPPMLDANAVEEAARGVLHLSSSPFSGHIPPPIERPPRAA